MKAFFGFVCILLALMTGGCSLAFSGTINGFDDFILVWGLGGIPALIFALLALRILRELPSK